ncbi:MAG: sulfite exporter TauE/SafE family protein [Halothiobacillaceae bacterium]|nr:sulfite exporter TauE/SafE family protein [Halothiobacillaceae bacterium]
MSFRRKAGGAFAGGIIGTLGGLIGLGGAEFRLPVLVALFRLPTLEAVIFNKAMSLVVVAAALLFRSGEVAFSELIARADILVNLLAGSLIGAWFAAGQAMRLSGPALNRVLLVLLIGLALLMFGEALFGHGENTGGLVADGPLRWLAGFIAGLGIGAVAALLGVAGGELLIPTLVLLYGVDIKLAGSLSLAISLPTMLAGFFRYREAAAFAVLGRERGLFLFMAVGSLAGAALGAVLLGSVPSGALTLLLALILLVSAVKVFRH